MERPENIKSDCGYEIRSSESAASEALERVLGYLRRLRRTGAETRGWTQNTRDHLEEKLRALAALGKKAGGEAILADLLAWEAHILQVIRHYMQEVSETINRIKTLNPPLTTDQLKPFLQAVESDRSETITALEPLTLAVEALSRHKQSRAAANRPRTAA
jgi:hypothetical protein